jgi:translation initiation factor IF-2
LLSPISAEQDKALRVVIRTDVHRSAEALEGCLRAIDSKKIKLEITSIGVGPISKNDIELASAAGATIVTFNTKFENGAQSLAKNQRVPIIQHNIIYEIIDQVRDAMAALLDPELHEQKLGAAEVRQIFSLKSETIAGCMVTEGKILRDQFVRIIRKKTVIFQGKFISIKHLKEDVAEIRAGFECGIKVSSFDQFEIGDIIECFEIKKIQPACKNRGQQRLTRLNELVCHEFNSILRTLFRDDLLDVTITEVQVSPDLHDAYVFVSIVGDEENEQKYLNC